ncbi:hypothetical protein QJR52_07780 [Clostridium baratii]|uniref:hypothetical protein n=1 Tax=Clostridium baratii TaxID=1561 RepID=UPI0030D1D20E
MDIYRVPLTIIFKEQNPYRILSNYFKFNNYKKDTHSNLDMNNFIHLYQNIESRYSKDEIENLFYIIDEKMNFKIGKYKLEKSVFNLLIHYTDSILEYNGNNIQCNYKDLLKWRITSHKLDHDMLISAYVAYKDILIGKKRRSYDWDINLKSNNIRLHNMLSKGMAENHFHLNGSAPTYYLNWISIMNNLKNVNKCDLDKNRLEIDLDGKIEIKSSIVVAAILRIMLFKSINNINYEANEDEFKKLKRILKKIINEESVDKQILGLFTREIQSEISSLKVLYGKDFNYKNKLVKVDYTVTKDIDISDKSTRLFSGERKLMYECFKRVYSSDKDFDKYKDIFYAYLILKSKFRSEFIQGNNMVGFSNFSDFQDRKTGYIQNKDILSDAVAPIAILSSIKNQNVVSLEARMSPWDKASDNRNIIKNYDKVIANQIYNDKNNQWVKYTDSYRNVDKEELSINERILLDEKSIRDIEKIKDKFFYVYHFIKFKDDQPLKNNNVMTHCRHYKYRKKIKKQALALAKLREGDPRIAKRFLGIDAAASELVARPEIYGQTFRFLKNHLPSNNFYNNIYKYDKIENLKTTYHVGEDFLDIIDGLRAIDEAILFLELKHGDRIGHAIALGIDVEEWYKSKFNRVHLCKQDILDNIAWLIYKIKEFRVKDGAILIDKLTPIYNKYFNEIYTEDKNENNEYYTRNKYSVIAPVDIYIAAWKLRGDNPEYYLNDSEMDKELRFWDRCAIRKENKYNEYNETIKKLYKRYHYDGGVKERGNKKEVFKIERFIIEAAKIVQKNMQVFIRERGIGIETNPSSNYLIGTFKRYDKHPILNLYNLGITVDEDMSDEYSQMFVSINTDDQGVFGSLLENEYALMAIALEKAKDKDGKTKYSQAMIYDWLDKIRTMGLEQSFSIENKKYT